MTPHLHRSRHICGSYSPKDFRIFDFCRFPQAPKVSFFWGVENPKTQNTFRRSIFRQNFDFRFFRQNCPLESPEQLATIKKMFPACLGVENRFLKRYRIQFSKSGHIIGGFLTLEICPSVNRVYLELGLF